MANREELGILRLARAGGTAAQLALGKLYLVGSAGLPKSMPTALHWLARAAAQDCAEAWMQIGAHIPIDVARQSPQPVALWYERAYDSGVVRAGLVLAQLVLGQADAAASLRAKALVALGAAARAGLADAQWLLSQQAVPGTAAAPETRAAEAAPDAQRWLERAANGGVTPAQYALAAQAWDCGEWNTFLERALELARAISLAAPANPERAKAAGWQLAQQDALLLSRCAQALTLAAPSDPIDDGLVQRFWELAAHQGERGAQMALGLWFARMDADGQRSANGIVCANFKKAIRWLTQAGEQGLAEAWYALARIYVKPEFSQRSVAEALAYLERAGEMGHRAAQLECGLAAWRNRRDADGNDVRAVYWLQKAAAQGCAEARAALARVAPRPQSPAWPALAASKLTRALSGNQPLLAARLELATWFNLSRPEALLLDVVAADCGHCLVVDIRASFGRSKRRLLPVQTAQERHALDRIVRLFDNVDCGPGGPEGNYRQRLYRLKTVLDSAAHDAQYELAA